jgi:hypothetical protein
MPSYSQAEFFRLMEEVIAQGGEHLDVVHEHIYHTELSGGPVTDALQGEVKYCNEAALFELPYEPHGSDMLGTIRLCAIDDRMGLMPRFAQAKAPGTGE